jgi:uncharacterized membrane protein YfcA
MSLEILTINVDTYSIVYLALASLVSWFISTITGGGSSFLMMPIIGLVLGTPAIPSVITVGATFGNTERAIVYWKSIRWSVIRWELIGFAAGSCLGAFTLTNIHADWLTILIALYILFSAISLFRKRETAALTVRSWYFLPAGFSYAWLSAILGSIGPILTPLYLGYGLSKEEFLATQAASRAILHFIKITAYIGFGILSVDNFWYGVLIGIAAFPGNWLGHLAVEKISDKLFRQIVLGFMLLSSLLMLGQVMFTNS